MRYFIQIVCIVLIICHFSLSHAAIPVEERQALIDLYNSTDGDNWTNNDGWLGESGTECSWFGVTCDDEKKHITKINLGVTGNNLTGGINKSIKYLKELIYINFTNNTINNIPNEIGNLYRLTSLSLGNNKLKIIPSEIGQLSNLIYLSLVGNEITSLPPEIGNLPNLTSLNLGGNDLISLPPEIGNLSNVEGIDTVWASIMPPNFHVPEITDAYNTPIIERPKIPLSHQGNGRYEGNYPGFTLNGIYRVSFYCEDLGGNVVSKEIVLNVVDGQSQMPGDLDKNGKLTLCDAILSLQSLAGMDVNVDSSARILCNGLVGPCEGIKILKEMIK